MPLRVAAAALAVLLAGAASPAGAQVRCQNADAAPELLLDPTLGTVSAGRRF